MGESHACENADGGGLSGSVVAEKPRDAPLVDVQVQPVHSLCHRTGLVVAVEQVTSGTAPKKGEQKIASLTFTFGNRARLNGLST